MYSLKYYVFSIKKSGNKLFDVSTHLMYFNKKNSSISYVNAYICNFLKEVHFMKNNIWIQYEQTPQIHINILSKNLDMTLYLDKSTNLISRKPKGVKDKPIKF